MPIVVNCTIAGNSARFFPGVEIRPPFNNAAAARTFVNNIVTGGDSAIPRRDVAVHNLISGNVGGASNFSGEPQFVRDGQFDFDRLVPVEGRTGTVAPIPGRAELRRGCLPRRPRLRVAGGVSVAIALRLSVSV